MVCVWHVDTVYPGTQAALVRTDITRYSDFKVCNSVGYDTSSTISVGFDDPLPAGSYVPPLLPIVDC